MRMKHLRERIMQGEDAGEHSVVRASTVVIGAGPAGLAVGACLKRQGVPCTILEASEQVGSAWRNHYDRLHLHSNKGLSALPHFSFPSEYPRYPSRLQFVRYLEAYADHFELRPRFGQRVTCVRRKNSTWEIQTQTARYHSDVVVIATGHAHVPIIPSWPGQDAYPGRMLHSSRYKNGSPFAGQTVLVVGFGNSGAEIALDLYEHGATPRIAVRSPVNVIPRDLLGLPVLAVALLLSKLPSRVADMLTRPIQQVLYGDLHHYGLKPLRYGPMRQVGQDGRVPVIDIGTIDLIREGHVEVRPGLERFEGGESVFSDGRHESYDAIILATGYRPGVEAFLEIDEVVLDERGCPLQSGTEVAPGLFFCGFYLSPTGVLRASNLEARRIASAIREKSK